MAGDIVVVTKVDRLGRSTREPLELIERIGKARRLLSVPRRSSLGYLQLAGQAAAAIADFERDFVRAAGIEFGRKRKLSDHQRAKAVRRPAAGETLAAIAKSYGMAISMISRL